LTSGIFAIPSREVLIQAQPLPRKNGSNQNKSVPIRAWRPLPD
jgi:hypothetical protein